MDNKNIICSNCATENEEKYDYCKNCGTKLQKSFENEQEDSFSKSEEPNESQNYSYTGQNNYAPPPQPDYTNYYGQSANDTYVETIGGIPYGEVSVFVGKKAPKYMNVFSKMEITGSKTAWHWPTAILSFFMGPLGAALWFFYRKMYKPAIILSAIGVVITSISALIMGPVASSADELIDIIFNIAQQETIDVQTLNEVTIRSEIANLLSGFVSLGTAIICGLFTHGWYKQHIHNTILKYRSSNVDMRYYQLGLMSIGGTSGGMLALGIAVMFFVENISSIIFAVLSVL